jgi:hypothetical protein
MSRAAVTSAIRYLLAIPLITVLIPLALIAIGIWVLYAAVLHLLVWLCWCTRGTHVLLVTSDSPVWHDHIETDLRPRLPESTVTLNWSQRRVWRWYSLPVRVFHFFGGSREFCPMVVVFRPLRLATTFRFWKPFRDFKQGDQRALEEVERELLLFLACCR